MHEGLFPFFLLHLLVHVLLLLNVVMSVCSSTRQQRGKRLEFLDLDAASLAIDSTCHLLRLMRVCVSL